jgi:hypothetical protein
MATKLKRKAAPAASRRTKRLGTAIKARAKVSSSDFGTMADYWQTPVFTTEERLGRIASLGKRVEGYIHFMCKIGGLNGSSKEIKDRAVTVFYERLLFMEKELSRIQEEVQLG